MSILSFVHTVAILNFLLGDRAKKFLLVCSGVIPVLALFSVSHFKRHFTDFTYAALREVIRDGELIRPVFVNKSASPTVRYLLEYGPYRGTKGLSERLVIETDAEEKSKMPITFENGAGFSMILSEISGARVGEYLGRIRGRKHSVRYVDGTTVIVDVQ